MCEPNKSSSVPECEFKLWGTRFVLGGVLRYAGSIPVELEAEVFVFPELRKLRCLAEDLGDVMLE